MGEPTRSHTSHRQLSVFGVFCEPFRAIGTLAHERSLWVLAMVPSVLFVLVAGAGAAMARPVYRRAGAMLLRMLGHSSPALLVALVGKVVVAILLAFIVLAVAMLAVPPLASPFMDRLAARVDPYGAVDEPLATSVARSIRVALAGLFVMAAVQVSLVALAWFLPHLSFAWIPLGVGASVLGLAYDALDWPLARRGLGTRERLVWMRRNTRTALGIGLACWVLSLVPGLPLFLLPAIVVGGVRAVNATEGQS